MVAVTTTQATPATFGQTTNIVTHELLFTEAEVDVKAASGSFASFDAMYRGKASWIASLTALAGGTTPTVAFTWQHSPDNVTFFDIATEAALTTTGFKQRIVAEHLHRYLRVSWVTTGAPTTATATVWVRAT